MKPLPDRGAHEIIERSWERMFDPRWTNRAVTRKRAEKIIQAVLWELWLDDVMEPSVPLLVELFGMRRNATK
jgi:hypothetical protein